MNAQGLFTSHKTRVICAGLVVYVVVLVAVHSVIKHKMHVFAVSASSPSSPIEGRVANVKATEYWISLFVWESPPSVLRLDIQMPDGVGSEMYDLINIDVHQRMANMGLIKSNSASILLPAIYLSRYIIPFLVSLLVMYILDQRRRKLAMVNICRNCGYSLNGLTSTICPECGHRVKPIEMIAAESAAC